MTVRIVEEPSSKLAEYARISIAFDVQEELSVVADDDGLGGLRLIARAVAAPYVKDYDSEPSHHPTTWGGRFDGSGWTVLTALRDGARLGGAVVVRDSPGVEILEGRRDLAVLWDLRVAPAARGSGIGAALFRAVEQWARRRAARWLKAETQNINVGACRFYARQGCTLGAIHRFAYPTLPDEVQLFWYKQLGVGDDSD